MKQFYLSEITTKDKFIHQGIYFKPQKLVKRALLWIHGLTSTFYSNIKLVELLTEQCEARGYGLAAFNNRGHDIVTGIKKLNPQEPKGYTRVNGGAGYEVFSGCVYDIEAGIDFLVSQGFSEVILIGHSTGANKVCFYAGKTKHPNLTGVVLASPTSDRLVPTLDKNKLRKDLKSLQRLINEGKGDELLTGYHIFPATPKRFVSSFSPDSEEDVFHYGEANPKLTYFSKIKVPLLVLLGSLDESLDRSAKQVVAVFDSHQKSVNYISAIIPGALHSYNGKENNVVEIIVRWISKII